MVEILQGNNHDAQSALQIKCRSCGGTMVFSPKTKSLLCIYCGNTQPLSLSHAKIQENNYDLWSKKKMDNRAHGIMDVSTEAVHVDCKQCGASVEIESTKSSTKCPYCGTPLMLEESQVKRFWQPNYLLPFAIEKKQCSEIFQKWLNGKWFLKSKYKNGNVLEDKIKGVYYPFWAYGAHTSTYYEGERGTDHTVTRKGANGKEVSETVTNWVRVSGTIVKDFKNVLVSASNNLPNQIVAEHKTWPIDEVVEYSPEFTAGFSTEVYTMDFTESIDIAKIKMENQINKDIRKDIGGDRQQINKTDIEYSDLVFKLLLLPLWVSAFTIKDKTYHFIINGYTGEVHGDYPLDKLKIILVIFVAVVIVALLYYFLK